MTRNCILMGVFSQMVTMRLLTAHSSASRCSGFASGPSGQTANVSVALPPGLPVSEPAPCDGHAGRGTLVSARGTVPVASPGLAAHGRDSAGDAGWLPG